MTRTLADMTPAERADCVGMWCVGRHSDLVILAGVEDQAVVVFPNGGWRWDKLPDITPRFDLPRAWTPSGDPVPGEWQYHPAYTGVYQDGTTSLNLIGVETYSKQDAEWECADIHRDDPAVRFFPVRRYVTDWEEA